MKKNKKVWLLAVPIILILGYMIWDSYSQLGIKDIPGDFEEVAFVRNEQNKGGIERIYAVTVGDLHNAKYEDCAELFPTNDFNSVTRVFFFDKNKPYPTTLKIEPPHYDTSKYEAINIIKRRGTK
ncbi:hypothetical protein EDC17_102229 [Sphingobacterium alimentarium]|uniref:Uncharacterized protein n=1 Tax=Sphingobacterium alimentarium TaxID=797292 RepID=A0A4V2VU74_9SPHI|nr:hypothetical protein [Sphingobacterium alimentarium]TCV12860.1 hypothetical protein EDC17_102229 [Sphingobacterium alimentarium]